jgi:hypothetical protein
MKISRFFDELGIFLAEAKQNEISTLHNPGKQYGVMDR